MIEFFCNINTGKLEISIKEFEKSKFQSAIECLKENNCKFNFETKLWEKSIFDAEDLEKELSYQGFSVEFSELEKKNISLYLSNLKELEQSKSRIIFNESLLKFPPLKGIHPFENFQKEDISRAIRQNRFLFNWQMGLGKSFALTALIENLRYYKKIDKCLIFSTGVGVYNLKDELLKFGTTLKDEEIFVLNSISEKSFEDRDLFNTEKYPYKIIIMTYDSFKSINNYYYDKANIPARLPKQIEEKVKLEQEYKKNFKAAQKLLGIKADEAEELLKKDKNYLNIQRDLKNLRAKLHPSEKVKYQKSYIPIVEWLQGHNGGLFLDEVHTINNPGSRRSQLLNMNITYFKYRYEFTGTLADKYEKLYQPLKILDKALVDGKSYEDWLSGYVQLGNRFSKYAINDDTWNLEKINNLNKVLLTTYGSKRMMNECLDLPMDYDVPTIYLEMSQKQRQIYEEFTKEELKAASLRKLAGEATIKDSIMNMFGVFQLAVDNPECIIGSPTYEKFPLELQKLIKSYKYENDSVKMDALKDVLSDRVDESDERGIVWYYHPKTAECLKKVLKKYDPVVVEAGMGKDDISNVIKEFKNNNKHKIIIASINIMNTSVTLIECKFQCYLEKTYNYTVYEQSRGRIHRPGKDAMSRTYTFCYKNSIDYIQAENLRTKGNLLNSLMNKDYISQDNWKRIFNATQGMSF